MQTFAPLIGAVLRLAREARGLTRSELAQRLEVTVAAVSNAENGHRPPPPDSIRRWADALEVPHPVLQRLIPLRDGLIPQEGSTGAFTPGDSVEAERAAERVIRETLAELLKDTPATLDQVSESPQTDLTVRLPDGRVRLIDFKTLWSRHDRSGVGVEPYLRALIELERNPDKTWSGRRDAEMRAGLAITAVIKDLRTPDLERIRGYADRIAEEASAESRSR